MRDAGELLRLMRGESVSVPAQGGASVFLWLQHILYEIPDATDNWAKIVGSLAWPITAAGGVFMFRQPIRQALDAFAKRVEKGNVKVGNLFEITGGTEVIPLTAEPPKSLADSSDAFSIEALAELVDDERGLAELLKWVGSNVGQDVQLLDFLTEPSYADARKRAYAELVRKGI